MNENDILKKYSTNYEQYLKDLIIELEDQVLDCVEGSPRIDRVVARVKSIESFMNKALKMENGTFKYKNPFTEIQDQIGVRIICFYKSDVPRVEKLIKDYFRPIEEKRKEPLETNQFDYEGTHYILLIPNDIRDPKVSKNDCPEVFELQIKTLYQHAWAEANHDLAYKSEDELKKDQKRKIAFTAAQSWGADEIFDELAKILIKK